MATRKIKDAKDLSSNELIYFKGHAKATYMSDGTTVEDAINNIEIPSLDDYVTKEDLNSKQDTITDLEVIRQGAAKGATALQSYTEQYKGTVTAVKVNGTIYIPESTVGLVDIGTVITSHQDISGKQDKLVSGTNIKTINGESILGEGNINIESSSEQVQSDWNETDTTSAAYIANKIPFEMVKDGIPKYDLYPEDYDYTNAIELSHTNLLLDLSLFLGENSKIHLRGNGNVLLTFGSENNCIKTSSVGQPILVVDGHDIKFRGDGKGTKFLADDGTYKEISSNSSSSTGSGAYAEVNHGTSDTTFTLTPNTFHVWDNVTTLDLSFGEETEGIVNEFLFQFTSGSTPTTLTLPDTIKWANDEVPTIEANKIYQISILKGLASVLVLSIFPFTLSVGDNGEAGVALYEYLYNNYGETTTGTPITKEIYDPQGIPVDMIIYGTYSGYTGYWMNGYGTETTSYCLQSSGLVSMVQPQSPGSPK